MAKTITVIPGDGIGPEITHATLRTLDALDCGLEYEIAYDATSVISASIDASRRSRMLLFDCPRVSLPNESRALAVGISMMATSIDARIEAEIAIATSE